MSKKMRAELKSYCFDNSFRLSTEMNSKINDLRKEKEEIDEKIDAIVEYLGCHFDTIAEKKPYDFFEYFASRGSSKAEAVIKTILVKNKNNKTKK